MAHGLLGRNHGRLDRGAIVAADGRTSAGRKGWWRSAVACCWAWMMLDMGVARRRWAAVAGKVGEGGGVDGGDEMTGSCSWLDRAAGNWASRSGQGRAHDRADGVAGRRYLAVDGLPGRWQLLVKADRAAEDACRRILGAVRHGGKLDRAALPVGDENGEDGDCQHDLGVMGSGEMLVGVACLGCSWWRTARSGWRAWRVRTLLG
ncbi:hypothetical protein ACLOJK_036584 [Asimina triloba]